MQTDDDLIVDIEEHETPEDAESESADFVEEKSESADFVEEKSESADFVEEKSESAVLEPIEVDVWMDLEDRYERDPYFSVYADEELYSLLYSLYYGTLKKEHTAQRLARLEMQLLKDTLEQLKHTRAPLVSIPAHLRPIYRGLLKDGASDYQNYKSLFTKASQLSYAEGQQLLRSRYLNVFQPTHLLEPLVQPNHRQEFEIVPLKESPLVPLEQEEQDGGAPKPKKKATVEPEEKEKKPKAKAKPKTKSKVKPPVAPVSEAKNRLVYLPQDETPIPIDGVLRFSWMPSRALPELYLYERIEFVEPTLVETIPLEQLDWKKPSSILRALHTMKKTSLTETLQTLTELTDPHRLRIFLAHAGYRLDALTPDEWSETQHTLNRLAQSQPLKHTRIQRLLWNVPPVPEMRPSVQSPFLRFQTWIEHAWEDLKKHRSTYRNQLALLEKKTDLFQKHPGFTTDLYDLIERLRSQQIDLEEAIQTAHALFEENHQQTFVDFLRELTDVDTDAPLAEFLQRVQTAQSHWSRLDASVVPEPRRFLTEVSMHPAFVKGSDGAHSFQIEDWVRQEAFMEPESSGPEPEALEEPETFGAFGAFGALEDPEARVEDPPESKDAFEQLPPLIEDQSVDSEGVASPWAASIPTDSTPGQREILHYAGKMLHVLQQWTDLPLSLERAFHFANTHAPSLHLRLSQREQWKQAFPEATDADLQSLLNQTPVWSATLRPEDTPRIRETYKNLQREFKKTLLETFLYLLTWWVVHLQDAYLRQPKGFQPQFAPCWPVWAFYGIPMSSGVDKGIAKYLTCTLYTHLEEDPDTPFELLRAVSEQKCLERIAKYAQAPEFESLVHHLKEQWRSRWKEIARQEKQHELRLEHLEKLTDKPQEYLSLYVQLFLHLPKLLARAGPAAKKQSIMVPVANSCCYQSLDAQFQAFQDVRETGLYTHWMAFQGKPTRRKSGLKIPLFARTRGDGIVPKGTLHEPIHTCKEPFTLPRDTPEGAAPSPLGITVEQWNALVDALHEPQWRRTVAPTGPDLDVRRFQQSLNGWLQAAYPKLKKGLETWETFLDQGTWTEKMRLLERFRMYYHDERDNYASLNWIDAWVDRCTAMHYEWTQMLRRWRPAPETMLMELLNVVLYRCLSLPSVVNEERTGFTTPVNGVALEQMEPRWLRTLQEARLERVLSDLKKTRLPTQKAIQDYYATVRERLKEEALSEYRSKTIEEIKEMQEVKRLKLKSTVDASRRGNIKVPVSARLVATDATLESEGLAEHRVYASWNADPPMEALDP